jgi:outer membrane protein assembly factor BamB
MMVAWRSQGRSRADARGVGVMLLLALLAPETRAAASQPTSVNAGVVAASDEDTQQIWTSFRGPGARGHAVHANPPLTWSVKEDRNILWKAQVPTHGMSSPVVWGRRLFLTGADDSGRQVYCFDTDTGKLWWRHDVDGVPGFPPGSKLPRVLEEAGLAASTATTDGRCLAAVFATGELVCVNMKGERIWDRHLGLPRNHYGHASSLLSHEGLLFVQYDQESDSKLLAFDMASGRPVWQASRGAISWSSPLLVDNQGRMELILTNSRAVDSYDPTTGRLLWHVECLGGEVAPSAAYADGIVFVSSEEATGSAIDVGSHGADPRILWQWDEALPDATSPLAKDGYVVVPTAFGAVTCLDAKTGRVLWAEEFDRGFWSSPIAVDDRVYMTDLSGSTQVFSLDDKFELLGKSEIGERAYATPAFVGDRIYIRGLMHLFCVAAEPE